MLDVQMDELPPPCDVLVYEPGKREVLEPEPDPWPYELKTMPGLRMPSADECLRSEFQSVLSEEEPVFCLSDMVEEEGGESLVLMGGGESDCLILGDW